MLYIYSLVKFVKFLSLCSVASLGLVSPGLVSPGAANGWCHPIFSSKKLMTFLDIASGE